MPKSYSPSNRPSQLQYWAMRAPRLLVVGGASLDVLHFSGQTARSAGGAGLYTALAAARAGARVTMYAPRPDPMPEELRPALDRLDWVGPTVPPDALPRFEIVNRGDGRTELVSLFWGAESELRPGAAPDAGEGWVYCVPFADPALQLEFVRHFEARGARIACGTYAPLAEAHTVLVREAAARAIAFFCNEAESQTLFGSEDGEVPAGRLRFVTRGAAGAHVHQGAHLTQIAGLNACVLDPTGAGDTFCGTVLARLAQGDHPVEAARRGVAHAARMVEDVGPRALLREGRAPEPPADDRVVVDAEGLGRVAALLARTPEVRAFDFVGDVFPRVGHPRALDFFFAATLQQFGFWTLHEDRWGGPVVASLGGRPLKGSDYLWAAYLRWLEEDPPGLSAAAHAGLHAETFDRRLTDDDGRQPLPEPTTYLELARSYGRDLMALGLTPAAMVAQAAASGSPVRVLLQQLDHIGGYKEDPLRKKSALLALILQERPEGFLPRGDDLPPIVDYHVQRSLLRLGILRVEQGRLADRLAARRLLDTDEEDAVRRAAFRAMLRLRDQSGRSMAACDYFLFQMRHRCPETREPDCPRCPADPACAHRKDLFQPVFRTTFY
jgi:sugar/nucleoside kinase (ribokinase family)